MAKEQTFVILPKSIKVEEITAFLEDNYFGFSESIFEAETSDGGDMHRIFLLNGESVKILIFPQVLPKDCWGYDGVLVILDHTETSKEIVEKLLNKFGGLYKNEWESLEFIKF